MAHGGTVPRRPTPLNPDDGPRARFAIALRKLRDDAGFDAPTIDVIAARNGIPRSTLYAAMRGERIPTVPVLAVLVRAWNGDEKWWLAARSRTEDEIERLRQERRAAIGHEGGITAQYMVEPPDRHEVEKLVELMGAARLRSREDLLRISPELLGQEANPDGTAEIGGESIRPPQSPSLPAEQGPGHDLGTDEGASDVRGDVPPARSENLLAPLDGIIEELEAGPTAQSQNKWSAVRKFVGNPTIRTLASEAGLPFRTVIRVMSGDLNGTTEAKAVLAVLRRRMAELRHPLPADE